MSQNAATTPETSLPESRFHGLDRLALVGAIGGPIAGGSFANTRQAAGAAGTMV